MDKLRVLNVLEDEFLAHHASALKQMRQSIKRNERNRKNRSKLKTNIKKLRSVIESGETSCVVPRGWSATKDRFGAVCVQRS